VPRHYCSRACQYAKWAKERDKNARKCRRCGELIPRRNQNVFCSSECFQADRAERFPVKEEQFCKNCGSLITTGKNRKFCDPECRSKYIKKNKKKTCPVCGKTYSSKSKHCSMECFLSTTQKQVSCCICGEKFKIHKDKIRKHYICSEDCMDAGTQNNLGPWKIINKKKAHKKKKIRVSVRWNVLERDNFKCVYCGYGTDDGVKLHVDHVIPESIGGGSDMDNLVTSCIDCNLGKSNSILSGIPPSILNISAKGL